MQIRTAVGELTSDDKEIIEEVKEALASKNAEKRGEIIDDLCLCMPDVLYAISQNSTEILELCSSKEFNERLVECPRYGLFLPKENVVSIADEKEDKIIVTPFQQHMGFYLFEEAKKSKNTTLLDKACKLGSYHALSHRMDLTLKNIQEAPKNTIENLSEVNARIEQLFADAATIGSLYRSLGYFKAATVLQAAFISYLDYFKLEAVQRLERMHVEHTSEAKIIKIKKSVAEKPEKSQDIVAIRDSLLEKMFINFYLAYAASKMSVSMSLNLALNEGKNLLKGFEKLFTSWEGGQKYLKENLHYLTGNPSALFSNVRLAIGKQISEHPEEFDNLRL